MQTDCSSSAILRYEKRFFISRRQIQLLRTPVRFLRRRLGFISFSHVSTSLPSARAFSSMSAASRGSILSSASCLPGIPRTGDAILRASRVAFGFTEASSHQYMYSFACTFASNLVINHLYIYILIIFNSLFAPFLILQLHCISCCEYANVHNVGYLKAFLFLFLSETFEVQAAAVLCTGWECLKGLVESP